jgi:16S rRNA (cytosine967-C5)-methyltransferase
VLAAPRGDHGHCGGGARTHADTLEELDARAVVAAISNAEIDLADAGASRRAQLWPHRHGTDAMSISLLRRR